jgi:hypothetical protein
MMDIVTTTNAALLVLTVASFLNGVIITTMVASHFVDRADRRGWREGWAQAERYAQELSRQQ